MKQTGPSQSRRPEETQPAASASGQAHPGDGPARLDRSNGETIAYWRSEGQGVGLVWLSGFHSDMTGSKAVRVADWAAASGRPCLRFDYFGHGASSGAFSNGTIGCWRDDTLAALDGLTDGPQILVGSSMGGWLALLAALARPDRVAGLVLIAPAPDFTEDLMWAGFPDAVKTELQETGRWMRPSAYGDEPYPITMDLIEDGRSHLLLRAPIALSCPVRILHGMDDADVPWQRSLTLLERLQAADVTATFVKGGDHRLSTEADLERLTATIAALAETVDPRR
ncbi:MAG: alpha/beta hydrolase [Alphaproteobacteria bacterium]